MSNAKITHYTVFNRITGETTTYKTSAGASRAVDRMDNAYGAYICTRKAHWSDEPVSEGAYLGMVADRGLAAF